MNGRYVVMGANGGVGEALALILAERGHDVVVTMRDPELASAAVRTATSSIHRVDVMQAEACEREMAAIAQASPVSGFAYCIGSMDIAPLKNAKDEAFLKSFEVNALGAVRALRALEGALRTGQGNVVLFSTIAVQQGFANHAVIAAAKGAVEGLTRSLAAEWAGHVRVNCIAPSLTDTAIARPLTSNAAMRETIEKMHPIARLGEAADSAALAAFLLSPDAGWITGQVFHVDGGRSTLRTVRG